MQARQSMDVDGKYGETPDSLGASDGGSGRLRLFYDLREILGNDWLAMTLWH